MKSPPPDRTTQKDKHPEAKHDRLTVSLKTLSHLMDVHRSSIRRWLNEAGIQPITFGQGRNTAIRYRWEEIQQWLDTRPRVQ
jgi:hypothetical protein